MPSKKTPQPRRRWSLWRALRILLLVGAAIVLFLLPPCLYYFFSFYHALEQEVVTRMSGKRWNIPSRIYSDSTIIYPGQNLKDIGFFERLARLNYHRTDPGKVSARGEYSYNATTGKLAIFLHSFAYPYRQFGGELVELTVSKNDIIQSMHDVGMGKTIYSIELEPELISGIFQ